MNETSITNINFVAGFKFGLAATLGGFVASVIVLPAISCLLFIIVSITGGGLMSILGQMR